MNSRVIYSFVAAFVFILGYGSSAAACSCVPERPVCEAFGSAKAVFVGKVIAAREQRKHKNEDGTFTTFEVGEIYFQLEEAFLGVKGPRVVIHSGTGGGDCGYWFLKGKRYVVYAYGDSPGFLSTSICTRTRQLADADDDLAFLRDLPRKGTGGRIFGTVAAALKDPTKDGWRTPKPLSGLTVKIVSEQKTLDAVTDSEGKYELTGLQSGQYKVYAEVPEYFYRGDYWVREIRLNDRGCAQLDFFARNDSRITGRVIRPDGSGLAKANVELVPAENAGVVKSTRGLDQTWADEKGEFGLGQIAPGRYLLGINLTSSPRAEAPYPRTFYPGVTDPAKAMVVEVGLGEKLANIDIQLPDVLTERVVRGFVVWPDGTLAAGVELYIEDVNYPGQCVGGCSQKTDSQGRFELTAYSGYDYRVIAMADASAKRKENVYGQSLPFNFSTDLAGLKIVLSISGRPWDKRDSEAESKSGEKPD